MKERMIREFVFFYYLEGVNGIKNILNVNEINVIVLIILYMVFKMIGKNSDEYCCLLLKCLEESFNIVMYFFLK